MCIIMQNADNTKESVNKLHKKPLEKFKKAYMFFVQMLLLY